MIVGMIWDETDDKNKPFETGAFSLEHLKPACKTGGAPLLYFRDFDPPSWQAFIVRKKELKADGTLTFFITNAMQSLDGHTEQPDECTVDTKNRDDVWINHPSTVDMTVGKAVQEKEYGFLFLSAAYIKRTMAAKNAGTDSKWPKGSEFTIPELKAIRDTVRRVLRESAQHSLTSDEKDLLNRFAGSL